MRTVKEISRLSGVSIRTLHYYDEINLMKPSKVNNLGYRFYSDEDLLRLQQILLFRELGISLRRVTEIMNNDDFDTRKVLECQKRMLSIKRNRITYLMNQVDKLLESSSDIETNLFDLGESEWELVWNEIYCKQGEVQKEILPTVYNFVELLKQEKKEKILDLGCGTGRHSLYLAQNGFMVTATDISQKGVDVTEKKVKEYGFPIETACHDIRNIPFKDNTFDAILCSWVSGHGDVDDMKKHAKEMLRVVKTGGLIFVDYPSKEDKQYRVGIEISKDTFLDNMPGEEKIPHHYSDKQEILDLYKEHEISVKPYTYLVGTVDNPQIEIKAFIVICRK